MAFVIDSWGFFRASRYFPSYNEGEVTVQYSIRGLPVDSGLMIDSESGVISGSPSMIGSLADSLDVYNNLLPVNVVANFNYDGYFDAANQVEQLILLKFVAGSSPCCCVVLLYCATVLLCY